MATIFLTGSTGFAGSHLLDSLLAAGVRVYGLIHPTTGHQPFPDHPNFVPVEGDVTDQQGLLAHFAKIEPDVVYHLGGFASPSGSWKHPAQTLAINAGGTANILDASVNTSKPKVIVVTSALLYGTLSESDLPVSENTQPSPTHPYAVSKWMASMLVKLYWKRYSLPVIEARPFNHIGPRQAQGFVVPDFASQIARIAHGRLEPVVKVGNLDAERDFTDVRDIVRAYMLLADMGTPGESYLVCSGIPVSIKHILGTLISISGVDVEVIQDPERFHPLETPVIYGTNAKINRETGWQPTIPLEKSLSDSYDDWLIKTQDE